MSKLYTAWSKIALVLVLSVPATTAAAKCNGNMAPAAKVLRRLGYDRGVVNRMVEYAPKLVDFVAENKIPPTAYSTVRDGDTAIPVSYRRLVLDSVYDYKPRLATKGYLGNIWYGKRSYVMNICKVALSIGWAPDPAAIKKIAFILELQVPDHSDFRASILTTGAAFPRKLIPDDRAIIRRVGIMTPDGKTKWFTYDEFFDEDGNIRPGF